MDLVSPQSVLFIYQDTLSETISSKKKDQETIVKKEKILQQNGQINTDREARWCVPSY